MDITTFNLIQTIEMDAITRIPSDFSRDDAPPCTRAPTGVQHFLKTLSQHRCCCCQILMKGNTTPQWLDFLSAPNYFSIHSGGRESHPHPLPPPPPPPQHRLQHCTEAQAATSCLIAFHMTDYCNG